MELRSKMHPIIKRIYMKKVLLTLFTYLILVNMYAQNKSDLYGRWRMNNKDNAPSLLTLIKPSEGDRLYGMGRFIEFKEDGTYEENASARCGLDDSRYRYTGKWEYDPQNKTIELSEITVLNDRPNIYNKYKVLSSGKIQLVSSENDTIVVKIMKPWEKVSPKN